MPKAPPENRKDATGKKAAPAADMGPSKGPTPPAMGLGRRSRLRPDAPKPAPPAKPHRPQVAFPKKNQPPTAPAFAARLPLALGKRFDLVRSFLLKQKGVTEDVYFYGPKSGWALRYLVGGRPLCSLHLHDEVPVGIVSLEPAAGAGIDWKALSPVAHRARKQAHGSPSLLWLDVPLEGTGAADLKAILRAKLASLSAPAVPAAE